MNDYELPEGAELSLLALPVGATVHCESGVVHVKQEGRGREQVIARGGVFYPVGPGRISVRALRAARVVLDEDALRTIEALRPVAA
jgi:hypothetical protein